ncbi:hypothetical protein ACQ4M3_00985 [Leptolyngbya sp. AN03gr2]|uniref:hypothetical protein n=1 Tax=unclassified Leptolyngbya TaxID=2650499 RepID=UPI003D31161A
MKTEAPANPLKKELHQLLDRVRETVDSHGISIEEDEVIVLVSQLICRLRHDRQLSQILQELLDNLRFSRG